MTPSPSNPMDTVLCAMDAVEALRQNETLISSAANPADEKRLLKEELRRRYKNNGIEVSEEILDAGVEETYAKRFTFVPTESWGKRALCALLLQKNVQIKAVTAAIFIGVLTYIGITAPSHLANRQIHHATAEVSKTASNIATYQKYEIPRIEETNFPVLNEVAKKLQRQVYEPQQAEIAYALQQAQESIKPFTSEPISLEKTKDALAACVKADEFIKKFEAAKTTILQTQEKQRLINQAYAQATRVQGSIQRQPYQQRAQDYLKQAAAAAMDINPEEILRISQGLTQIQQQMEDAETLPTKIIAANLTLQKTTDDPQVLQQANNILLEAKQQLDIGNIPQLAVQYKAITDLLAAVEETYVLRIVSVPGQKSAVWRYPVGQPNTKNYYLIVEAVLPDGSLKNMSIVSEEDNSVRQTTQWGERISEAEYETIKADKMDDGIIQNNIVAEKVRGKLPLTYKIGIKKADSSNPNSGRITSW